MQCVCVSCRLLWLASLQSLMINSSCSNSNFCPCYAVSCIRWFVLFINGIRLTCSYAWDVLLAEWSDDKCKLICWSSLFSSACKTLLLSVWRATVHRVSNCMTCNCVAECMMRVTVWHATMLLSVWCALCNSVAERALQLCILCVCVCLVAGWRNSIKLQFTQSTEWTADKVPTVSATVSKCQRQRAICQQASVINCGT